MQQETGKIDAKLGTVSRTAPQLRHVPVAGALAAFPEDRNGGAVSFLARLL